MILSKLFLPEGRMCRVKRNEEKKAGKKKKEKEQEAIWNGFSQKKKINEKKESKFWLMSMHQSEIFYIVTRNLHQNVAAMSKSALIANFGQNYHRNTKKLFERLKKRVFLGKFSIERVKNSLRVDIPSTT